ncbi:ArsR/SmtB family transcription factor [Geomesophilobacter sediminis]|uniref:Helix-turn-helix transcriptional regulator n=1 Tax=Geomesophilobacter sediminis TaxID=2798584 RepID=A0A8J7JKA9_9BACT|nr:metalloregulator ArsR/SmtB family transcription factor [Geomesophilobacter sediminis]MBJ6723725.1 helix-turn-helix transcriptional regulator [Geomesophilobacter sediminis]
MEKKLQEGALLLRALGHPIRLRIAAGLARESACVMQIWECLDLPQAIVSQHLKVMKQSGILVSHREGTRVRYSLRTPEIAELVGLLHLN